jgi:hypothetical protein
MSRHLTVEDKEYIFEWSKSEGHWKSVWELSKELNVSCYIIGNFRSFHQLHAPSMRGKIIVCLNCRKEFTRKHRRSVVFCSSQCWIEFRKKSVKNVEKVCPVCRKTFSITWSLRSKVYCSRICRHTGIKFPKPTKICPTCKKEFHDKGKYCSKSCVPHPMYFKGNKEKRALKIFIFALSQINRNVYNEVLTSLRENSEFSYRKFYGDLRIRKNGIRSGFIGREGRIGSRTILCTHNLPKFKCKECRNEFYRNRYRNLSPESKERRREQTKKWRQSHKKPVEEYPVNYLEEETVENISNKLRFDYNRKVYISQS